VSDPALERFKAAIPLGEVVGRYVQLRRRGRELVGLCPFHREKTPSFTVVEDKGFFHCFGCGAHGNAIDFVMRMEGLDFAGALQRLSDMTGIPLPEREKGRGDRAPKPEPGLLEALAAACAWYRRMLASPAGERARAYLEGRGVGPEAVATFELGYAPPGPDALARHLRGTGFARELLEQAGLVLVRADGRMVDRFRERVMFPIHDRRGRVVGFGGRTLGDHPAKYLNSPETPVFRKGELLYNLHRAARPARTRGRLVLVEGYMDVIALAGADIAEAVAPLGTALTPAQLQLAWRLADEPVLCFDGDAAGRRAAWRAALNALPHLRPGRSLRFSFLPAGEDPDSLVRSRGPEAFKALLEAAEPLVEVLWRFELEAADPTTPERRAALSRRVGELVREIRDPAVRAAYAGELYARLRALRPAPGSRGVKRAGAGTAVGRRMPHPAAARRLAAEMERLSLEVAAEVAARLLVPVLRDPALLLDHEEAFAEAELDSPEGEALRREIMHWLAEAERLDRESLHDHLSRYGFGDLVQRMLQHAPAASSDASSGNGPDAWLEVLRHCVARARRQRDLRVVTDLVRRRGAIAVPAPDDVDGP